MTPSPPDEALHFRGKTLTPESPRPLHIPEPANIPVLENQMDPVFNDTSTYERSEYQQEQQQQQHHHHHHHQQPQENGWSGLPTDGQDGLSLDAGSSQQQQPVMNDTSVTTADFYSSQPAGEGGHVGSSHSHAPTVVPVPQDFATASEIDKASNPARVDDAKEDIGSTSAGVNFQTLLDNLSHPPSGAAADAPSSLAEGSSLHQAPTDESVQGIPARPYQDPSTQPNYPSNEGGDYHHLPPAPTAATSTAYATQQPSNHARMPFPPSMASGGAPGTENSAGNLPPPPAGVESQASQENKKVRADKQPLRVGKGGDDDAPWAPEVQKKYDEFLRDERIYVTEGLWDRFPVGSRLFVGQSRPFSYISKNTRLTWYFSCAGNLPTERVTKRDMFHIFHKYGKLAQISIKQAYGFIQFLEAGACHAALQAEQGALVRGRKIRECSSLHHLFFRGLIANRCQILKSPSHNGLPGPVRQRRPAHPRPVVRGPLSPPVPLSELLAIASIGLMSLAVFRLATSAMSPPTEGATIIDPLDRRRPGLFELVGTGTDHGIGLLKGSIVVNVDGHAPLGLALPDLLGLPEPLVPRIPGTVDTAVPARDRVGSMRGRQTSPCLDGRPETCQRYRSWFWKKSIGSLPVSLSHLALTDLWPAISSSMWKTLFATGVCG